MGQFRALRFGLESSRFRVLGFRIWCGNEESRDWRFGVGRFWALGSGRAFGYVDVLGLLSLNASTAAFEGLRHPGSHVELSQEEVSSICL